VIEPYFAYINKTYCKLMDNWSGFGVGSGSKNQPNSEMLAKLSKSFPDERGCRLQLQSIIEAERGKKQKQYLEQWQNTQPTHRLPMPVENFLLALGKTSGHTNKLEGSGLNIKIDGVKRTYDCFELEFRQQAHQNWNILYDDNNLNEVLAISADQKHRFVLQEKYIGSMAIADHNEDDGWQRQKIKDYNNTAIKYITDTREENANVLDQFFNQNPLLNDTLAKHLLTDSRGQHKDNKSRERLQPQAEKVLIEQEMTMQKESVKSWQNEQDEYINNKIDFNNYI
jgi:hypothetical protein